MNLDYVLNAYTQFMLSRLRKVFPCVLSVFHNTRAVSACAPHVLPWLPSVFHNARAA